MNRKVNRLHHAKERHGSENQNEFNLV